MRDKIESYCYRTAIRILEATEWIALKLGFECGGDNYPNILQEIDHIAILIGDFGLKIGK